MKSECTILPPNADPPIPQTTILFTFEKDFGKARFFKSVAISLICSGRYSIEPSTWPASSLLISIKLSRFCMDYTFYKTHTFTQKLPCKIDLKSPLLNSSHQITS